MESKAFLINKAIELCNLEQVLCDQLSIQTGVEDLDSILPEGWRGKIKECYKDTMDEVYTYEEVEALVGWFSSDLGSSVMSKFNALQEVFMPKFQKVFLG